MIAKNAAIAWGGIEPDAKEALAKVLDYEQRGFHDIAIRDELGRTVTRQELVRLAALEGRTPDT